MVKCEDECHEWKMSSRWNNTNNYMMNMTCRYELNIKNNHHYIQYNNIKGKLTTWVFLQNTCWHNLGWNDISHAIKHLDLIFIYWYHYNTIYFHVLWLIIIMNGKGEYFWSSKWYFLSTISIIVDVTG